MRVKIVMYNKAPNRQYSINIKDLLLEIIN